MRTLFALLLLLFPRAFRDAFAAEMREVFQAQLGEARAAGILARVRLAWRTAGGMIGAAWHERRASRAGAGRGLPWVETVFADLRLAGRHLARAPLVSLVVIATVAAGIAGAATIFSALNALVLRPLPGTTDGERLVLIERRTTSRSSTRNAGPSAA